MKVLHVLDHSAPLRSGYSFRTEAILREQNKLGWDTWHLTSGKHGSTANSIDKEGDFSYYRTAATVGVASRIGLAREAMLMAKLTRRIEELTARLQPNVIHAHSPVLNILPALLVGRRARVPVVYELRSLWEDSAVEKGKLQHGSLRYRASRLAESFALRNCDHVITISRGLCADVVARGVRASSVTLVPNGVDLRQFPFSIERSASLEGRLNLRDTRIIGYAGSFHPYEGLSILVRAFAEVLRRLPDVRLLLIGSGIEDSSLRTFAQTIGVAEKVIFTGQISHHAISDYYSLLDVLVYPRLSSRLTDLVTPLKPLEAMAQGIPVIASKIGGHLELIDDGRTGFLFEAGDSSVLAATLIRVLEDKDAVTRVTRAAREYVEVERTWTCAVAHTREAYQKAGVPPAFLYA